MIGIEMILHGFTSVYRILVLMLSKVIEDFVQLVYSVLNKPYHLPPFLIGAVIVLSSKKGRGLKLIQVPFSNYTGRGGEIHKSYQ